MELLPNLSHWVLQIVVQFVSRLPRFNVVIAMLVGPEQALVMEKEVDALFGKEAIDVIPPLDRESGFYSCHFIFSGGGWGLCRLLICICAIKHLSNMLTIKGVFFFFLR